MHSDFVAAYFIFHILFIVLNRFIATAQGRDTISAICLSLVAGPLAYLYYLAVGPSNNVNR